MTVNAHTIVQHEIQIKNEIAIHANVKVKSIVHAKKDYSWNPSTCICEHSKYLKGTVDNLQLCDEIINVRDAVSTQVKNTISTNVTSTASINSHNKK